MFKWMFSFFQSKETPLSYIAEKTCEKSDDNSKETIYLVECEQCYVCNLDIKIPSDLEVDDNIVCPHCDMNNTLVKSGRLIRSERIAIYQKYNGIMYQRDSLGLIGDLEKTFESEFQYTRKMRKHGSFSKNEYKSLYGKWYRKKVKAIEALESKKSEELKPLLNEEKEIRNKLQTNA